MKPMFHRKPGAAWQTILGVVVSAEGLVLPPGKDRWEVGECCRDKKRKTKHMRSYEKPVSGPELTCFPTVPCFFFQKNL